MGGRLDRRFQSPNIVLLVQGAVAVALTMSGSYVQLSTYVVFVSFLYYGLSAAAVLVMRRTEPDLPRPFRAWGYPVTPLVFIAFAGLAVALFFAGLAALGSSSTPLTRGRLSWGGKPGGTPSSPASIRRGSAPDPSGLRTAPRVR